MSVWTFFLEVRICLISWRNDNLKQETYEVPGLYNVVYPYKYHFILDQLEKCGQHNPFLVLIVPVAPHHMEARGEMTAWSKKEWCWFCFYWAYQAGNTWKLYRRIFIRRTCTTGTSNLKWECTSLKYTRKKKCALTLFLIVGTNFLVYITFSTQSWARERFQLWINDQRSYHVVYPYKYHFILDQLEKCGQHNPFLVLIVPVAPHHMEARAAIRKTWGNDSLVQKGVVLVLFLLGLPSGKHSEALQAHVHQENMHHRDLLQSNFIDSYRNLTIKTMVMLEWLTEHCPHAHYAVKVDADILLNIKGLMKMLRSPYVLQNNYITGQVWYNNIVIRDPANKFYIPFSVYPHFVYPPYPLGMCYIMSMDLPKKILQVSKEIKPIFIEDAYIGLCLERLHIAPVNPPNPAQFVVSPPSWYSRCYYANLIAVVTDNPDELVYYWKDITKYGSLC